MLNGYLWRVGSACSVMHIVHCDLESLGHLFCSNIVLWHLELFRISIEECFYGFLIVVVEMLYHELRNFAFSGLDSNMFL